MSKTKITVNNNGSLKISLLKMKTREYRSEISFVSQNELIGARAFLFSSVGAEELVNEMIANDSNLKF